MTISKMIVMSRHHELQNVYSIRRARWYVAGKEWKIDDVEVKIIAFVIKPS